MSLGAENADCVQLSTILEVEHVVAIIFLKKYEKVLSQLNKELQSSCESHVLKENF